MTASVYSSLCLIDKSKVAIKSFKKEVYFNQDNGNGKVFDFIAIRKDFLRNSKFSLSSIINIFQN